MTKNTALATAAFVLLYALAIHLFNEGTKPTITNNKNISPRSIEWADLMPDEDLKFADPITSASSESSNSAQKITSATNSTERHLPTIGHNSRFEKTLKDAIAEAKKPVKSPLKALIRSYTVRHEFNYIKIKLAGYIVPFEFNEQKITTAFFLVPYYGACIHVPPPPPNQIIYARIPQGINITNIYNPYWVTGTLKIETVTKDNGVSAYSLDAESVTEYQEQ
jgi:uncharacterized protein